MSSGISSSDSSSPPQNLRLSSLFNYPSPTVTYDHNLAVPTKISTFLPPGLLTPISSVHSLFQVNPDPIGKGSQAIVFQGRPVLSDDGSTSEAAQPGDLVAIKAVKMDHLSTKKRWVRLGREVAILKNLRHPHILHLEGAYCSVNRIYLVTEFLAGGELFDYIIARGYFPETESRSYLRQIASALVYLHANGIIHRDLKPENILLVKRKPFARLKLCDFGYAKYLDPRSLMQHSACGSPMYAAPEVFGNLPYSVDADVFSLGVIMFILLVGYSPFNPSREDDDSMLKVVSSFSAEEAFLDPAWSDISEAAKDLIKMSILHGSQGRIRAADFLNHPWMLGRTSLAAVRPDAAELARRNRFENSPPGVRESMLAMPIVDALRSSFPPPIDFDLDDPVADDAFPLFSSDTDLSSASDSDLLADDLN